MVVGGKTKEKRTLFLYACHSVIKHTYRHITAHVFMCIRHLLYIYNLTNDKHEMNMRTDFFFFFFPFLMKERHVLDFHP